MLANNGMQRTALRAADDAGGVRLAGESSGAWPS